MTMNDDGSNYYQEQLWAACRDLDGLRRTVRRVAGEMRKRYSRPDLQKPEPGLIADHAVDVMYSLLRWAQRLEDLDGGPGASMSDIELEKLALQKIRKNPGISIRELVQDFKSIGNLSEVAAQRTVERLVEKGPLRLDAQLKLREEKNEVKR